MDTDFQGALINGGMLMKGKLYMTKQVRQYDRFQGASYTLVYFSRD